MREQGHRTPTFCRHAPLFSPASNTMFPPRPITLRAGLRPTPPRLPFRSSKPKPSRRAVGGGGGASARSPTGLATSAPFPPAAAAAPGLLSAGAGAVGMAGVLAYAGAVSP
jgi:hypothetical protein